MAKRLPDGEYEIMEFIWRQDPPVTTAMAFEAIGREKGIKIQTIVTLFGRLTERGFLRFERGRGRERDFYPLISREEYLQQETAHFVKRYHKNSTLSLLTALHQSPMTQEELDTLSAWVDAQREGEGL